MNERIRELIKQATHVEEPDGLFLREVFDQAKFAELIVKECADVILQWKSEPFPLDPEFAARLIKEHFRVEK